MYGMGPGVFPKGKEPELPAHPHCMCYLRPLMSGSLKLKSETPKERIDKGGKEWLDKQSKTARQNILGVMGEMQYKKGGNWQSVARGYGNRYMKSRLEIPSYFYRGKESGIKGTILKDIARAKILLELEGIKEDKYHRFSKSANIYKENELVELSKNLNELAAKHTTEKSAWSGKLVILDNISEMGKRWNCDIATPRKITPIAILHELMHSWSVSHYNFTAYALHRIEEESAVEYFTKEIAFKEKIQLVASAYDPFVTILKRTAKFCGYNDYDFSKMFFETRLYERLDWLEEIIYSRGMELNKTIPEIERMQKIIGRAFRG